MHAGQFSCFVFLLSTEFFSETNSLKNSLRNTIRLSSSMDLDQAPLFVGPELDLNCL